MIINRLLDGQGPLCLDQYYLKTKATSATNGNAPGLSSVAAMAMTTATDLNYVIPLGQNISINLVSWFSVDEFYVHLKEQQTSFSEFLKSVQMVPKVPIRSHPVGRGTLVLTIYPTTGLYYRAEVYDHNEKLQKYKVVFTDIGVRGIVTVDQLFENPFPVTKVPKFSHKCCLVDREKLGRLRDPEAMKEIGAIIQGAVQLTCNVKERLKDDLNVIRVTVDGRDLLEKICEDEEEGTVKNEPISRATTKTAADRESEVNNEGGGGDGKGQAAAELLRNQKLWIKPVDFLSKDVFRFSIKDIKGGHLYKGAYERGAVHLGIYTAVEVVRITNQM